MNSDRTPQNKTTYKSPNRRSGNKVGLIVCAVVLVAALGFLAYALISRAKTQQVNDELQAIASTPVATPSQEPDPTETPNPIPINFEELQAKYPDIYAYIDIPGTTISYPIFQHPSDDSFYLNHNADGVYDRPMGGGAIYTELCNAKDFSDFNTIIYGHDMNDLTMFGTLQYYRDPQYLDEHREIIIYTPTEKRVYTIFAAVIFDDRYLPYYYDQTTEAGRLSYLHDTTNVRDLNSQVLDDITLSADDHIITLSTCVDNQPNNRYLIEAVLNEE